MERPKRRRYKDNPYFLIYDEKEDKYIIKNHHEPIVSREVFEEA